MLADAHYECIKAFSETDFTEDLRKIDVPALVLHGDDDQIVPYADAAPLTSKLLKNATLSGMGATKASKTTTRLRRLHGYFNWLSLLPRRL